MLYNSASTLDTVALSVYDAGLYSGSFFHEPSVYVVNKDSTVHADYTSFTQCLLDLKDDDSEKIIEIWEGDYNIYQEYQDAGVPVYTGNNPVQDYFNYCVWIPRNTHIIGKGFVRLMWMPTKANNPEITYAQCYTVSPVNVADSMTLENVEIHCKNGRYCIHNDALGKPEYTGAIQKYINVKCYKYNNETDEQNRQYGTPHTTGFGIDRSMTHEYINCEFYNESETTWANAFYGHDRNIVGGVTLSKSTSSEIILSDCIIKTLGHTPVRFVSGYTNNTMQIRVKLSNTYLSGQIKLEGVGKRNSFDLTLLNSGNPTIDIDDASNPFLPKIYPPA